MKFARVKLKKDASVHDVVAEGDQYREISASPLQDWTYTGEVYPASEAVLLAPLAPNQIYGIGANYVPPGQTPPKELPDLPVFFLKPNNSVIGPEAAILLPSGLDEVKFEAEIAVVIGKPAYRVEASRALEVVFGYTAANDVTAPQLFHEAGHWTIGKACPTFTPLGPIIETDLNLDQAVIRSSLNGEIKQDSPLAQIIVNIQEIIARLSRYVQLEPGDVILTGAPAGADFLRDGDTIECSVAGIGVLRNSVKKS